MKLVCPCVVCLGAVLALPSVALSEDAAVAEDSKPPGGRGAAKGEAPSGARYSDVELIRDKWGIPHVFADTDEGAMYGLGYAAAEERGFQMHYCLRIIQGRLAELIGEAPKIRRRETAVDNDRKMRTFGFARAAAAAAANLDADSKRLLRAYCDGVNAYFRTTDKRKLHPLFAKLHMSPEPWRAEDCIVSWWHLGQFFATDGTRDLIAWRNATGRAGPARGGGRGQLPRPKPTALWTDDSAAVVQRHDVSDEWVGRTEALLRRYGLDKQLAPAGRPSGPKFSHAWVVGGKKTTTGAAVLVSDPQTPVRNPSLWHEFHVCGKTFNARGVGVPGSPGILIGFNKHVAWGVTALGSDQADLFRLRTDPKRPDQYFFDGRWRRMSVDRQRIRVAGGAPVPIVIRRTHFGPVVTDFAFARPGDPQVALKRVPICQTDGETIQGLFAMMRSRGAAEFYRALAGWRFPSANIVFGDGRGSIGYSVVAATPVRSASAVHGSRAAMDGTASKHDWQGYVPHELLPHVLDPAAGWLASGNHRPIASFYRIPIGISTGAGGHSLRSWRLYELLGARDRFRPEDVLAVHYDTVNPARRDIVRLGYHLRDVLKQPLSEDAAAALKHLDRWYRAGAPSDLATPGAEVAMGIGTFFRFVATPLADRHGGGESGLCRFLRDVGRRIAKDPEAPLDRQERQFVDNALAAAWRSAGGRQRGAPARWNAQARRQVTGRKLGWFESLDGFAGLDADGDLTCPPITCIDGGTIKSQAAQSYTQFVPLHDVDAAMSVLPPGHSDRRDDPRRASTMKLWETGRLHPAPLSRKAVERIAADRRALPN